MELSQLVKLIMRSWWIVALSAGAGVVGALLLLQTIDPMYKTSTTFAVTVRSEQLDSDDQARLINTYTQLITSQPVLDTVRANLGLSTSIENLEKQITVMNSQNTLLIEVAVADTDPQQAAIIANEVVTALIDQGRQLLGNDRIAGRATIQVIEAARPDTHPISPNRVRILLFGVVLTTTLAIGGLWLWEQFDTNLYASDQVEALLGIATLAAVPHNPKQRNNAALITIDNPMSPMAEAYRLLREQINYASQERLIRSLAIVSGGAKEGKSTIAANLAVIMAQAGIRVILVDGDLRLPSLHALFQQPDSAGLTEALAHIANSTNNGQLNLTLANTCVPGLKLLTSGAAPTNPAEVLHSPHMEQLLKRLHEQADIVIFDTPPLLTAVDGLVLARLCDATLLVVRSGATQQHALLRIRQQLQSFAIQPLGVVLNGAASDQSSFNSSAYYRRAPTIATTRPKPRSGWRRLGKAAGKTPQPVTPEQATPEPDDRDYTSTVTLETGAYTQEHYNGHVIS